MKVGSTAPACHGCAYYHLFVNVFCWFVGDLKVSVTIENKSVQINFHLVFTCDFQILFLKH